LSAIESGHGRKERKTEGMDAQRGYVPDDDKNFSPESLDLLKTASHHVLFLIKEEN
jgi:hypothetical protein